MEISNPIFYPSSGVPEKSTFHTLQTQETYTKISAVFFSVVSASIFIVSATTPLIGFHLVPVLATTSIVLAIVSIAANQFIQIKKYSFIYSSNNEPLPHMQSRHLSPRLRRSTVEGVPLVHCADTTLMRKRMIHAAKHNVVLSGNYCGEKAFDEILDIIEKKMTRKPHFKAIILSTTRFIDDSKSRGYSNKKKLARLEKLFPTRFQIIYNDTTWQHSNALKYTTNHTKALVVDYGKYCILGGSAVKDNFAKEGVDTPKMLRTSDYPFVEKSLTDNFLQLELLLTVFCKQNPTYASPKKLLAYVRTINTVKQGKKQSPNQIQKHLRKIYRHHLSKRSVRKLKRGNIPIAIRNIRKKIQQLKNPKDTSITASFIPGNFRDMDFAFKDTGTHHSQGRLLYLQLLSLGSRLSHLRDQKGRPFNTHSLLKTSAFTGKKHRTVHPTQALHSLLNRVIPNQNEIRTKVPGFDSRASGLTGKISMIASGPECPKNDLSAAVLKRIKRSKHEITINHMYFNPPKEIFDALQKAVQRGVRLNIITNDEYEECPNSHKLFGPNNKVVIHELLSKLSDKEKERVSIHMFRAKKKGLHKKAIMFDKKYILAGSSNFGYKSLVTSSDYEINFLLSSRKICKKTNEVFQEDIRHSEKIPSTFSVSFQEKIRSYFYRTFVDIWG